MKGGVCSYPDAKSQLDAAVKALTEHRGHVGYLTIDIGANDILACADPTTGAVDQTCAARAAQSIPKNLARITSALRQAGTRDTQYAGMTYYNPFLAAWLFGPAGQSAAKSSAALVKSENEAMSQVYKASGFKVADVAGAFSSDDFDTLVDLPGSGKVPVNVAKVCQLTWACTPKKDPHPNADGAKVITGAFAAVLPKTGVPAPGPAPSASATPAGSGAAGGGPGTAGNDPTPTGDLAETGASSNTSAIAGGGLAVVVAGTAAVYFARRRRTPEQN
ncbi:SGNH/GDSL hydrolase family protein [Streptomyces coeruleorubidus]|uniref:SGNH/GDSL hydrolase family protein n=1 Tax=Streptomyces coeruleorubidus TaxID=116188 RepID=UPI0036FE4AB2